MGLVQVDTETVTSATASVSLTGINSDDIYMVTGVGIGVETNIREINMRITKSGSAQSDSQYDFAYNRILSNAVFANLSATNNSFIRWDSDLGTGTSEFTNFIIYLYNFNSSSEFSYGTIEEVDVNHSANAMGAQGGFVHTVASASDGVNFQGESSSNILSGTFTLYKVT
ncbi:MAG: hypothetical protein CBD62_00900 [Candidatus Pelagibacter sp. TMED202]|nr:MAG: hypothetical protein CBD62_00900 [Candidatus Pelagibacter sp. TMED202]